MGWGGMGWDGISMAGKRSREWYWLLGLDWA